MCLKIGGAKRILNFTTTVIVKTCNHIEIAITRAHVLKPGDFIASGNKTKGNTRSRGDKFTA